MIEEGACVTAALAEQVQDIVATLMSSPHALALLPIVLDAIVHEFRTNTQVALKHLENRSIAFRNGSSPV